MLHGRFPKDLAHGHKPASKFCSIFRTVPAIRRVRIQNWKRVYRSSQKLRSHSTPYCKKILTLSSARKSFLAVRAEWFNTYVSKTLAKTHEFYITEFADDFNSLHCLGSNGPRFSFSSAIIQLVNKQSVWSLSIITFPNELQ